MGVFGNLRIANSAAVSAMDQSTQQNAAMVEETSAAARNLSGGVAALSDQAERFKVDGNLGNTSPRRPQPTQAAAHGAVPDGVRERAFA